MSVFISDIDTAKLYVQFFRPLAQCAVSLKSLKCLFIIITLWMLAYDSLKTKDKSGNPKSARGRLRQRSLTRGFHYKV